MSRKISQHLDELHLGILQVMTKKERFEYIKKYNNAERKIWLRKLITDYKLTSL